MLIIPKTLFHFVQATEESSLDYDSLASMLEQSAMWRSKPSLKRTWLQRLKKVKWMQHLSGRILKPSLQNSFLDEFTESLEVIPVSPSQSQESSLETKTPGTSGLSSENTFEQLDLFGASLKTSEDTLITDSEKSNQTWRNWVTQLTQEYSVRRKSVQAIAEKGYSSWPTPDCSDRRSKNSKQQGLSNKVKNWPTPREAMSRNDPTKDRKKGNIEDVVAACTQPDQENLNTNGKRQEQLNPAWVEQLMGLPTGWTDLGSWAMGLSHKRRQKHGEY